MAEHSGKLVRALLDIGFRTFPEFTSRVVINAYADATPPRPRPWSTATLPDNTARDRAAEDYVTWGGLTDRRWSGRHLPAEDRERVSPTIDELSALFERPDGEIERSDRTSVLFLFFAQWLTDSLLRTDATDHRATDSNHEIDLCALYGLSREKTAMLRQFDEESGKYTHLMDFNKELHGEGKGIFPPYLFERDEKDPSKARFDNSGKPVLRKRYAGDLRNPPLHSMDKIDLVTGSIAADRKAEVLANYFAMGLEHSNGTIGYVLINTLFLRAHNRIAGEIKKRMTARGEYETGWDDERVFQTTRNILIVILIKIVVEDYIAHIADQPFRMPIGLADRARWGKPNHIAIEFNLLYRWHSLVPDTLVFNGKEQNPAAFLHAPQNVVDIGPARLLADFSRERAGRISLMNLPRFLTDKRPNGSGAQWSTIGKTLDLMRKSRLKGFLDYRARFRLSFSVFGVPIWRSPRPDRDATIRDLVGDRPNPERAGKIADALETLYKSKKVSDIDWFVALFAEKHSGTTIMGDLMLAMVAYDAFTQALNNPLLSRAIYDNPRTFGPTGKAYINKIGNVQDFARFALDDERAVASLNVLA